MLGTTTEDIILNRATDIIFFQITMLQYHLIIQILRLMFLLRAREMTKFPGIYTAGLSKIWQAPLIFQIQFCQTQFQSIRQEKVT